MENKAGVMKYNKCEFIKKEVISFIENLGFKKIKTVNYYTYTEIIYKYKKYVFTIDIDNNSYILSRNTKEYVEQITSGMFNRPHHEQIFSILKQLFPIEYKNIRRKKISKLLNS